MIKVLFVCLGNICRSPAAEAVMNKIIKKEGLDKHILCDSAGTSGYHSGEPADSRMIEAGRQRGYKLTSRSRKIAPSTDFDEFEYIVTMDNSNYKNVKALDKIGKLDKKLFTMCSFCSNRSETEVPDPYYQGPEGFEEVLDLLEDACMGLLNHIKEHPKLEN